MTQMGSEMAQIATDRVISLTLLLYGLYKPY